MFDYVANFEINECM